MFRPADAVMLAALDLANVPPHDHPFVRYLWVRDADVKDVKASSFSLNWLASTLPYRPPVIGGGGHPTLMRVDLRAFSYSDEDLKRWLKTWEELAFDPSFSLLFTYDALKISTDAGGSLPPGVLRLEPTSKLIVIPSKPYTHTDGKSYKEKWEPVVRIPRPSLLDPWAVLESATGTLAPVVESDYFVNRALGSLRAAKEDANGKTFNSIFGGLYYDFAGVRTAKQAGKKKGTDLDVLFQDLGIIDDADGPVKAQDKLDKLGSEQRIAMIRSEVTKKPRMVAILPTLKSVRERGVLILTHDVTDDDIGINDYPFANLLAFRGKALEGIWVDSNGGQKYVLFDGQGARQNEVPFNVANDTTVPDGYTKRLHTISCITCHGMKKDTNGRNLDGWQPLPNDAPPLLPAVLTDLSRHKDNREAQSQIVHKYAGNADALLMELRRGTIGSVLRMTGPWPDDKDQTGVYRLTAERIDVIRRRYSYSEVDAGLMLRELGYDVGNEKPTDWLKKRLQVERFEDVRILQLMDGKALPRTQSEIVKGFLAERIEKSMRRGAE